jgi:hypothetical protein
LARAGGGRSVSCNHSSIASCRAITCPALLLQWICGKSVSPKGHPYVRHFLRRLIVARIALWPGRLAFPSGRARETSQTAPGSQDPPVRTPPSLAAFPDTPPTISRLRHAARSPRVSVCPDHFFRARRNSRPPDIHSPGKRGVRSGRCDRCGRCVARRPPVWGTGYPSEGMG